SKREVVGVEEPLGRAHAFSSEQRLDHTRLHLTGVGKRLDADFNLEIDVDEARIAHEYLAASLANAVHEVGQFCALLRAELERAQRISSDERAEPTAGPAETGAGALHERQPLSNFRIVFGADGAKRDRAKSLRRELLDRSGVFGIDAAAYRQWVGDSIEHAVQIGLGFVHRVGQIHDGISRQIGFRARSGAVANLEYVAIARNSTELAMSEGDGKARAAGVIHMRDHFSDTPKADDPAPGPMVMREVILEAAGVEQRPLPLPDLRAFERLEVLSVDLLKFNLRAGVPQVAEPAQAERLGLLEAVKECNAPAPVHIVERPLAFDGAAYTMSLLRRDILVASDAK